MTIDAYQTDVEMDIPTLEGTMHASIGDYIITGVRGEQYPCKPDIFVETYEPACEPDYEAGYRDGSIHYELDHCPACKNVAGLQEALEENAKLRKLFADFWAWADPPFALKSGTFEQFMEISDRARELGILK